MKHLNQSWPHQRSKTVLTGSLTYKQQYISNHKNIHLQEQNIKWLHTIYNKTNIVSQRKIVAEDGQNLDKGIYTSSDQKLHSV